jgi:hypothetical protein
VMERWSLGVERSAALIHYSFTPSLDS